MDGDLCMGDMICKFCDFNNDMQVRYCQRCGSFNFGSILGSGVRGISISPLAGMDFDNNNKQNQGSKVNKSYSLEDGSWFCPYCGNKNKVTEFLCSNCLR